MKGCAAISSPSDIRGRMLAVVTVSDWFWFLVFWEVMTLASYFLVIFENDKKENLSAGFIYFFMTHLTSAGLMVAVMFFVEPHGIFRLFGTPAIDEQPESICPSSAFVGLFYRFWHQSRNVSVRCMAADCATRRLRRALAHCSPES